jgi:cobalt-precorrin 5A hydrolase/precorrin-3B C17-methyltransferase
VNQTIQSNNSAQARATRPVWGLGFSQAAHGPLQLLLQADVVQQLVLPEACPSATEVLVREWREAEAFVVVGACGLVTRLIAPLLRDKQSDPAVVVLDTEGRFAIPLLGGHEAGGEELSQRVAALLGGSPVLTGSSGAAGRLALDEFGTAWGWRRGSGDWNSLMQTAARQAGRVGITQTGGCNHWRQLPAAAAIQGGEADGAGAGPAEIGRSPELVIGPQLGPGCRWHPPCLWLGMGCERGTSLSLLERLVDGQLGTVGLAAEAVAGLASVDRKGDEPALLELAKRRQWPLRLFGAEALAAVPVPNPSAAVAAVMGTASVAEAAALLAAGSGGLLLEPKQVAHRDSDEQGAATLAIAQMNGQWAPQRGQLHLVGSGPGRLDLLTPDARRALAEASVWVGYGLYLDLLEPLRRPDQLRCDGQLTEERQRCALALKLASQGLTVALVSSGESGIYGMAGLALELWLAEAPNQRPGFAVHPGISAVQLAAARIGAPLMHDFCTISLSDRLTPWPVIEQRLQAAAAGDFVMALYNPRSRGRDWQLQRACEILLDQRPATTPVLLARQLGRPEEELQLHTLAGLPVEQVDMLTLVLIGNSSSRNQEGWMVTPRGYPGAELA